MKSFIKYKINYTTFIVISSFIVTIVFVLRWKFGLRWWGILLGGIIIIFMALFLPFLVEREYKRLRFNLFKALQTGNRDGLEKLLRDALFLKLFAPRGVIYQELGFIAMQLGRFTEAFNYYSEAIEDISLLKDENLLHNFAEAAYFSGNLYYAIKGYEALLKRGKKHPTVYHNLAHSLVMEMQDLDRAMKLCESGLRQFGDNNFWFNSFYITKLEILLLKEGVKKVNEELEQFHDNTIEGPLKWRVALLKALVAFRENKMEEGKFLLNQAKSLGEGIALAKVEIGNWEVKLNLN